MSMLEEKMFVTEQEFRNVLNELIEEREVSQRMRTLLIRLYEEFSALAHMAQIKPISSNASAFEKLASEIYDVLVGDD